MLYFYNKQFALKFEEVSNNCRMIKLSVFEKISDNNY